MPEANIFFDHLPIELEVEIRQPGLPPQILRTVQLQPEGLLVLSGLDPPPPIGTVLEIQIVGELGDGALPPLVNVRVSQHNVSGFFLTFLSKD